MQTQKLILLPETINHLTSKHTHTIYYSRWTIDTDKLYFLLDKLTPVYPLFFTIVAEKERTISNNRVSIEISNISNYFKTLFIIKRDSSKYSKFFRKSINSSTLILILSEFNFVFSTGKKILQIVKLPCANNKRSN